MKTVHCLFTVVMLQLLGRAAFAQPLPLNAKQVPLAKDPHMAFEIADIQRHLLRIYRSFMPANVTRSTAHAKIEIQDRQLHKSHP
jgi:hypothetical protein